MNDDRPHYTNPVAEIKRADCETLIRLALEEDAPSGDPTSDSIFPDAVGRGLVVTRESGVLCGAAVARHLLDIDRERGEPALEVRFIKSDGDAFVKGDELLELRGPLRTLLRLERIVLNFLQYLSGISSTVAAARALAGEEIVVLDTRKTLPGYRRLAKYAVYMGGGTNHRIHLSEMAMIKDNHIAAAGSITEATRRIRERHPNIPVEIEVDEIAQLPEALSCFPEVVLLDNMGPDRVREALGVIKEFSDAARAAGNSAARAPRAPFVEVSGGWRPEQLASLRGMGRLGVSMGYLTHTTRFLDLSMEIG